MVTFSRLLTTPLCGVPQHTCSDLKEHHRTVFKGKGTRKLQLIPSLGTAGLKLWTQDYHCYARGPPLKNAGAGGAAAATNGARASPGVGCEAKATLGCWLVTEGAPAGKGRLYFVGNLPLGVAHNHTVEKRDGPVSEVYLLEETKHHVAGKVLHSGLATYSKAVSDLLRCAAASEAWLGCSCQLLPPDVPPCTRLLQTSRARMP